MLEIAVADKEERNYSSASSVIYLSTSADVVVEDRNYRRTERPRFQTQTSSVSPNPGTKASTTSPTMDRHRLPVSKTEIRKAPTAPLCDLNATLLRSVLLGAGSYVGHMSQPVIGCWIHRPLKQLLPRIELGLGMSSRTVAVPTERTT